MFSLEKFIPKQLKTEDMKLKELLFSHYNNYQKLINKLDEAKSIKVQDGLKELNDLKIQKIELEIKNIEDLFGMLREAKIHGISWHVEHNLNSQSWKFLRFGKVQGKVFEMNLHRFADTATILDDMDIKISSLSVVEYHEDFHVLKNTLEKIDKLKPIENLRKLLYNKANRIYKEKKDKFKNTFFEGEFKRDLNDVEYGIYNLLFFNYGDAQTFCINNTVSIHMNKDRLRYFSKKYNKDILLFSLGE